MGDSVVAVLLKHSVSRVSSSLMKALHYRAVVMVAIHVPCVQGTGCEDSVSSASSMNVVLLLVDVGKEERASETAFKSDDDHRESFKNQRRGRRLCARGAFASRRVRTHGGRGRLSRPRRAAADVAQTAPLEVGAH